MKANRILGVVVLVLVLGGLVLGANCAGKQGETGVGIESTVDNGNGTFTITYTDGSKFTTSNLTGPQGVQGLRGDTGATGPKGDPFMILPQPDVAANDRILDGVWRVGIDIRPGLHWTPTADGYWARLSGFGGTLDEIIANGNNAGPTYVQIAATDVGFESHRCSCWIRIGD